MTKEIPTRLVIDCSTGERQIIPLTAEEIAEREEMAAQAEADRLEREQAATALAALKASAKAKLIAGEPMTEAEASVLIG